MPPFRKRLQLGSSLPVPLVASKVSLYALVRRFACARYYYSYAVPRPRRFGCSSARRPLRLSLCNANALRNARRFRNVSWTRSIYHRVRVSQIKLKTCGAHALQPNVTWYCKNKKILSHRQRFLVRRILKKNHATALRITMYTCVCV